jgi:hypothetical protein
MLWRWMWRPWTRPLNERYFAPFADRLTMIVGDVTEDPALTGGMWGA